MDDGDCTEVVADGPVVHRVEAGALHVSGQDEGLEQGLRLGSGHRAPATAPAGVDAELLVNPPRSTRRRCAVPARCQSENCRPRQS